MKKLCIVTNQLDLCMHKFLGRSSSKFWGRSLHLVRPPVKIGEKINARAGSLGHNLVQFQETSQMVFSQFL